MSSQSGRDSGGDLFGLAKDGTTVPQDAANPRYIPSKPRPDQIASKNDPNNLGASNLAEAATNATDIPRTARDTATAEVLTGTGDQLPPQVDSKRLHQAPGGVTTDPFAKGSTRMAAHKAQESEFVTGASDGAVTDRAPGQEESSEDQIKDNIERKV